MTGLEGAGLYSSGMLVSGSVLSDRAMLICHLVSLIGVALQTGAQNVGMFIGCRFLIGVGLSWATMAAPVLITELAFPTHRAPITGLYNSSWYLGSIVAAWVTYGTFPINSTWSWRIPSVLQGIPAVLQLVLVFLIIPESPRWLIDHGKADEARRVLSKYHCNGDDKDPLVDFEMHEIQEAIRIEKEINRTTTYLSLFQTPGNRRRMLAIIPYSFFSQWSGVSRSSWAVLDKCHSLFSSEWYHLVLSQSCSERCRHHIAFPAELDQWHSTGLERCYSLWWCSCRRSSRTETSLAHFSCWDVHLLCCDHRCFSCLQQFPRRKP